MASNLVDIPVQRQASQASARRDFERRHRREDARNLLWNLRSRGIGMRRLGDTLLIDDEACLSDRDAGLVAELTPELCWWLDLEAARVEDRS